MPIPGWYVFQIANVVPHSSHSLLSLRGITICSKCGAFGVKRTRLLAKPCTFRCIVASDRALARMRQGHTPIINMSWPTSPCKSNRPHPLEAGVVPTTPPLSAPLALHSFDDPDVEDPFDLVEDEEL